MRITRAVVICERKLNIGHYQSATVGITLEVDIEHPEEGNTEQPPDVGQQIANAQHYALQLVRHQCQMELGRPLESFMTTPAE